MCGLWSRGHGRLGRGGGPGGDSPAVGALCAAGSAVPAHRGCQCHWVARRMFCRILPGHQAGWRRPDVCGQSCERRIAGVYRDAGSLGGGRVRGDQRRVRARCGRRAGRCGSGACRTPGWEAGPRPGKGLPLMILAIDLGSTSFKAALFDGRLRQVWSRAAPLRYRYGSDGRVELAAAGVEAAMRGVLPRRRDIAAIAVTSQAQTFAAVDRAGRAQRPFVSWQDGRAGNACAALRLLLPDFGLHSSFAELLPALQICQLRRRPPERGATVLLLPSYFVRRWTGESVTDENLAAMSGLYSLKLGAWWPAAMRACGLRECQLPRVVPIGAVAAFTARNDYGLPAGVPVVLAGNDQTAGAYGARLDRNGATLITLGTAQVVYRCVSRRPAAARDVIRGPFPGGRFYRMATDAFGGNVVNWARTVLAGCESGDAFFARARQSPAGCRGVAFDPERREWRGLGWHVASGEMARSVLESLSARLAGMRSRVCPAGPGTLLVAGGGARPEWRAIVSARLGGRLRPTSANPLVGAARMAMCKTRRRTRKAKQDEYPTDAARPRAGETAASSSRTT
ncbi:MAG: hypothetical protein C0404_00780 [Verrucomicrobia bacterium]|nr:hypothetical protein [Verrucomicrobiota bacterium]